MNLGIIDNDTNGAWSFEEASEDFVLTFTANTVTGSSTTGVDTFDFGTLIPKSDSATIEGTITLANGGTVDNATNNKIKIGENSEDLSFVFAANAASIESSTGVVVFDFGTVLPISTATSALGWAIAAGADTACNTTCAHACVFGFDDGAADAETIVACTDAAADKCLCAGPN